jgi:hypothetical protein
MQPRLGKLLSREMQDQEQAYNEMLERDVKLSNLSKLNISGTFLVFVVALTISRVPIQADDLPAFMTVTMFNDNFGAIKGLTQWVSQQASTTAHFVPLAWTIQWLDFSIVKALSGTETLAFHQVWMLRNLAWYLSFTIFSLWLLISSVSKFTPLKYYSIQKFILPLALISIASVSVLHVPWSIEPLASHQVYSLMPVITFSFSSWVAMNAFNAKENKLWLWFSVLLFINLCGLMIYEIYLAPMVILGVLLVKFSARKSVEFRNKKVFGYLLSSIMIPAVFLLIVRLNFSAKGYEGADFQFQWINFKGAFMSLITALPASNFARTLSETQTFPTFLLVPGVLAVIASTLTAFVFLKFRNQRLASVDFDPRMWLLSFILFGSAFGVSLAQSTNERWGSFLSVRGNVYMNHGFVYVFVAFAISLITLALLSRFKSASVFSLVLTLFQVAVILTILNNWGIATYDQRVHRNVAIVSSFIDLEYSKDQRCIIKKDFISIGYPEYYVSNVLPFGEDVFEKATKDSYCDE